MSDPICRERRPIANEINEMRIPRHKALTTRRPNPSVRPWRGRKSNDRAFFAFSETIRRNIPRTFRSDDFRFARSESAIKPVQNVCRGVHSEKCFAKMCFAAFLCALQDLLRGT